MERRQRARKPAAAPLVAYDLETERIAAGSPRPLYLTAYGADLHLQTPIRDMLHLRQLLRTYFLTEERRGTRFVAWNANRFDAYFVAVALVGDPEYRLRPYLTQNNTLRGLRISLATDADSRNVKSWEFLDGIAMTGLAGVSLEKFLETFAPDYRKMTGAIDFDREQFDPDNPKHCAYAMRDSEGLYHGITRAQQIMIDTFDEPLAVTMGGACIRIFTAHIPRGVTVDPLLPVTEEIVYEYVMRGGFCYCARRYHGPIWKYDLNQAYAAAMREAALPCGNLLHLQGAPDPKKLKAYIVRLSATNKRNRIPFYYRTVIGDRMRALFGTDEIRDTWVTSIEHRQLIAEGWAIDCVEFWAWSQTFDMREYVDKLETLRQTCEGGPKGAIGTMVKATGNHSYGKTLERAAPIEFVLAAECPPDFLPYYGDGSEPIDHVFYRIDTERRAKAHHQPQIGSFITAHVRMVVRRAALLAPASWLYADTDCVIFDRDMTRQLDIHPSRYGAWKIEEEGTEYRIIAKKVYQEVKPGGERKAKGLNVKRLTDDEFAAWYEGDVPEQEQTQVQNFLQVMQGAEMFRTQVRHGTAIEGLTKPRKGAKAPA